MIPSSVVRLLATAAFVASFVGPDLLAIHRIGGKDWEALFVLHPFVFGGVAAFQRDPRTRRLLLLLGLVAAVGTIAALAVGPGPPRLAVLRGVALAKAVAAVVLVVLVRRSALPTEPDGLR